MSESNALRVGWGGLLGGHPFDLEDWRDMLKQPFDPWMMEAPDYLILRSNLLDAASTSSEAYGRAEAIIELMNGALGISHKARPVRLNGIVEILVNGMHNRHVVSRLTAGDIRFKSLATVVALGADGQPKPPPAPQPSIPQRWLLIAADDDILADALTYFARGDDWFDIYKALECLFLKFQGERRFCALGWADAKEIERLKRTANNERHARKKNEPLANPMERGEARSLLAVLIARAFQEVEAAP